MYNFEPNINYARKESAFDSNFTRSRGISDKTPKKAKFISGLNSCLRPSAHFSPPKALSSLARFFESDQRQAGKTSAHQHKTGVGELGLM